MGDTTEATFTGLDYLRFVTSLTQRIRAAHPTEGLYEAADLQWWWRKPRPTDDMAQLFWLDAAAEPVAAVIATDWGGEIALAPMVLPGADPSWVAEVMTRGLAHYAALGVGAVDLEVDRNDEVGIGVLESHGFTTGGDGDTASLSVVEAWIDADDVPAGTSLPDGYRLVTRAEIADRPSHFANRNGPEAHVRLAQTSLYRPDLDLVVLGPDDDYAASGLFWHDPVTSTGLVEPMRTEDDHQRRGLARHVLTAGLWRLVDAGAERIKICFEPTNEAARRLYLDTGFVSAKDTVVYKGTTT